MAAAAAAAAAAATMAANVAGTHVAGTDVAGTVTFLSVLATMTPLRGRPCWRNSTMPGRKSWSSLFTVAGPSSRSKSRCSDPCCMPYGLRDPRSRARSRRSCMPARLRTCKRSCSALSHVLLVCTLKQRFSGVRFSGVRFSGVLYSRSCACSSGTHARAARALTQCARSLSVSVAHAPWVAGPDVAAAIVLPLSLDRTPFSTIYLTHNQTPVRSCT